MPDKEFRESLSKLVRDYAEEHKLDWLNVKVTQEWAGFSAKNETYKVTIEEQH